MLLGSQRMFAVQLQPPEDPVNINKLECRIGDYAMYSRTFEAEDLRHFSEAIHDQFAAHKKEGNSGTFFRPDIVYGIFSSSMFTSLYRSIFPKCIYKHQVMSFKHPVLQGELVTAKITITGWNPEKKDLNLHTMITKICKENNKTIVCVDGDSIVKVPYVNVIQ